MNCREKSLKERKSVAPINFGKCIMLRVSFKDVETRNETYVGEFNRIYSEHIGTYNCVCVQFYFFVIGIFMTKRKDNNKKNI